jgi:hypothetical protein
MDGKEREVWEGERRERERKRKKHEQCVGIGCREYPIANERNKICKINGKKEK